MEPLRLLIVDDVTLHRKFIKDALSPLPGIEVIGMVSSGRDALVRIGLLRPDIVTLDLEMPDMNGLEVLEELRKTGFRGAVIMISNYTSKGAPLTLKALELGAIDFILKPSLPTMEQNLTSLRAMFLPMAEALAQRKKINNLLHGRQREFTSPGPSVHHEENGSSPGFTLKRVDARPEIIAIGVSTGGPKALMTIMPLFPSTLKVPVLVVQHMPGEFTSEFAKSLDGKCPLVVKEGVEGEPLRPGHVYIAPGGRQMKVVQAAASRIVRVTDDPPENNCRPSVDYCFRSVAKLYGPKALGVIMTGMGRDGAVGARLLKERGARIIAQNKESSVVYGMPKAVIDAGLADCVSSLDTMVDAILENLK